MTRSECVTNETGLFTLKTVHWPRPPLLRSKRNYGSCRETVGVLSETTRVEVPPVAKHTVELRHCVVRSDITIAHLAERSAELVARCAGLALGEHMASEVERALSRGLELRAVAR